MNSGTRKRGSKKGNDVLDDLLGDLLSDDSPTHKKGTTASPSRQKSSLGKGGKFGEKDDQFYSAMAAMADSDGGSDVSEADVGKMANSLGGLDDMDADLFGDNFKPKGHAGRSGRSQKPTTPRQSSTKSRSGSKSPKRMPSPSRSDTPTSPPGSARSGSLKRKPVKPPSPSTTPSLPSTLPEQKPSTAPGKMNDLSEASENLKPGQVSSQRPDTAPKLKKKYDFGDFDPDDPLAGVLSDDDVDDISEGDRPKSATRPTQQSKPQEENVRITHKNGALDSPRRRNMMDRPPTRSGSNAGDKGGPESLKEAPIETPGKVIKPQTSVFSEDDGDLLDGLGLEGKSESAPVKKAEAVKVMTAAGDDEENRPARSVFDNLLGRSNTASQHLNPKEKKEFVLDSKYSSSFGGSGDGKEGEEDDFNFGSYQPSAASGSRPNSRRSVRFQDDDDIFGLDTKPSPRLKSPGSKGRTAPADMEWLEIASEKPSVTATSSVNAQAGSAAISGVTGSPQKSSSFGKPPTPSKQEQPAKSPESPKKLAPSSGGTKNISPRAWLGLQDSESDGEEFFKPKKSSARSATLPQSPQVAVPPSPKVTPKKPGKKEALLSPKAMPNGNVGGDNDDDDDWLARAKSRRQQMLKKGESNDELAKDSSDLLKDSGRDSERIVTSGRLENGMDNIDSQSLRVDLSSFIMDSPKPGIPSFSGESPAGGYSYHGKGLTSQPQVIIGSEHSQGTFSLPPGLQTSTPLSDPHIKSPGSAMSSSYLQSSNMIGQPAQQLSIQQQQYAQIQEQKKSQLLMQQQQLKDMLGNIENQYNSIRVPPSTSDFPSYSHMTSEVLDSLPEAHIKLKKVELEKQYLEALLESSKRRFEEEMLAVETSYRNRLQIVEDSNRKKESRLREENEELMQQHIARVRLQEQEKSDLINANFRKLEEFEVVKSKEIESVKDHHRVNVSALKRDHEEAMERLATAKNQEINMVANANNTSKNITAVVEQIQTNARDLGELQMKVESWNRQGLDEREISLKSKDEQLRMLQERLKRQEEDNERERKRLEELIARMESQLRDHTRCLEEDRWKLKQDQSRAEAQQRALEEERRLWLEQQARERVTMERTRENFLDEQRTAMAQISEERRCLVEERSKFSVEQKTVREKLQQDTMKHTQAEADYDILMRTIIEEKSQHAIRMQDVQREESRINSERNRLDRDRQALDQEREKLAEQAHQIRQQSTQIDHMTEAASRARQEGEQALEEAMHMNSMMEKREHDVHKQQQGFKVMEEHVSEEKLRLAKEKKEVENLKNASLCTNCHSPLHGGGHRHVVNGFHPFHSTAMPAGNATLHPQLASSLPAPISSNPLEVIASSIANDRAVRMMKIQALKDKEFLDAETVYLQSLRHMPYHSVKSNT